MLDTVASRATDAWRAQASAIACRKAIELFGLHCMACHLHPALESIWAARMIFVALAFPCAFACWYAFVGCGDDMHCCTQQ